MKIKIAPSILSADFARLGKQIKILESMKVDFIHVDVMDGHFVPNLTIGVPVVKSLRQHTKIPLDVHLMIDKPENFILPFAKAGSNIITVHVEAKGNPNQAINLIRAQNLKAGLALNPATPLSQIENYLDKIDLLLVMTVVPGFSGQKFMPEVLPKIKESRELIDKQNLSIDLEVDGGINSETAPQAVKAGANMLVAGSFVFIGDIKENLRKLRMSLSEEK